ncbi:hypothetical protein [Microlunatus flavus]|uniref:Uncharacterized protein n=1 Tax=Microlunatus flavus TaxID=1036181 RepID=A0A1H9LLC7_9ACTN|nr:hypothetical protein [Microlunatus flavus]SER12312.1 hypothetical protein SAMN05421756_10913 [Microlunatus flavus]
MTTGQLLQVIALVSARARHDEEAVKLLITEAGPHVIPNLIELLLLVLQQNTEGNAIAYLRFLSEQALAIQADEEADL